MARLFREVAGDLFAYACSLVQGDRGQAEDLVQETFQAAAEAWSTLMLLESQGKRRWLYAVLGNKRVDQWRKGRKLTFTDLLADGHSSLPGAVTAAEPVHQALCAVALEKCWAVIEDMPQQRHDVVLLAWWASWTTAEIAELKGIAQSTVRGHLKVARDELVDQVGVDVPILDDLEEGLSDCEWSELIGRESHVMRQKAESGGGERRATLLATAPALRTDALRRADGPRED
ncbi:RNA polymerase sigma factor [Streptomyces sp. NPDC005209]|uniref:RNA polymerase sigma factor n=1 Tax=Streptomyces sp. NPDC005209 TaxID=3156715 RepID=UPI0033ADCB07